MERLISLMPRSAPLDSDRTDRKTSYDSATGVLTVTTLKGGVLSVDFDTGDYTYKPTSASANYQEQVNFSVIDKDGDTVAGNQTLDVYRLKANSDKVLTNDVDGAVVIPAAVLLANDVLSGTSASISSTTAIVGGSVSGTSAITVGFIRITDPRNANHRRERDRCGLSY